MAVLHLSQTLQGSADGKERSRPGSSRTGGVVQIVIKIVVAISTLVAGFALGMWITRETKS